MNNEVGSGCPQKICVGDDNQWITLEWPYCWTYACTQGKMVPSTVLCFAGVLWEPAHCRPLYIVRGPHNVLNSNVWFLDFQLAWMLGTWQSMALWRLRCWEVEGHSVLTQDFSCQSSGALTLLSRAAHFFTGLAREKNFIQWVDARKMRLSCANSSLILAFTYKAVSRSGWAGHFRSQDNFRPRPGVWTSGRRYTERCNISRWTTYP